MQKPFLTIGIASYNYAEYLNQAYEQIKRQNFKNIEIIYCDDGSSDDSVQKIKRMMELEEEIPIRLIEGKHEGILANRNRILDYAQGEYLMLCDADDYMLDGCLEKLCNMARRYQADCVIGGFCEVSDSGQLLKKHVPDSHSSKWLYTWHHGQIYKTSLVKEHQIRFEKLPDDVFYLQKIHQYCRNVVFLPELVYVWRRCRISTSNDYGSNPAWHPVKLWENIAPFIAGLRDGQSDKREIINLNYYLYKWYYFNITDLWKEDAAHIRKYIKIMQYHMKNACADYQTARSIAGIMCAGDSHFARFAVVICWLAEKLHVLYFVVLARRFQHRLRK